MLPTILGLTLPASVFALSRTSHIAKEEEEDPCQCRNWDSVYRDFPVNCGQANELSFLTKQGFTWEHAEAGTEFGHFVCTAFFQVFTSNACVNVELGGPPSQGQWCYVSKDCADLRNGSRIGDTDISWKRCDGKHGDTVLRLQSPEDLDRLSKEADVDHGLLFNLAYPNLGYTRWEDVESIFEDMESGVTPMAGAEEKLRTVELDLRRKVQRAMSRPTAMVIYTEQGATTPFYVVKGRSVFVVEKAKNAKLMSTAGHYGRVNSMRCVYGCA